MMQALSLNPVQTSDLWGHGSLWGLTHWYICWMLEELQLWRFKCDHDAHHEYDVTHACLFVFQVFSNVIILGSVGVVTQEK